MLSSLQFKSQSHALFLGLSIVLASLCGHKLHAQSPQDAASHYEELPEFQSGLWWSPKHSGNGLDIQFAEDIVFIVLYTFDRFNDPIWYTAQGPLVDGQFSADLLKHSWNTKTHQHDGYIKEGSIQFQINSPLSISANIQVITGPVQVDLEPFAQSNVSEDILPRTGLWFNPKNPGYGFSYIEQQRWKFGLFYFYNEKGEPIWYWGSGRSNENIRLDRHKGNCLSCPDRLTGRLSSKTGTATFDFSSQKQARIKIDLEQESQWALQNIEIQMLSQAESDRPSFIRLSRFKDSDNFTQYLRDGFSNLTVGRTLDFSAGPGTQSSSPAISNTNIQEKGVDEIDYLKSDGACAFTFPSDSRNSVASFEIDKEGHINSKTYFGKRSYFSADNTRLTDLNDLGLYLTESHLATISTRYLRYYENGWNEDQSWQGGTSYIDIHQRNECQLESSELVSLGGYTVDSRRIDNALYVLWRSVPDIGVRLTSSTKEELQQAVANRPLRDLVPHIRLGGGYWQPVLNKDNTYLLGGQANPASNFLLLSRIDLNNPENVKTIAIAGQSEAFYMSANAVYIASSTQPYRNGSPSGFSRYFYSTQIHKFSLQEEMNYEGSGSVDGFIEDSSELASFRFSESKGNLAVVTQYGDNSDLRYKLSIIGPSEIRKGILTYKSVLPNERRPEPLGEINKKLAATRFINDKMYAVTSKQSDPLYVVNLEDHSDPFIEGVLEVPGFSKYLHPLPNDKLVGVGYAADREGRTNGNQVSLFDISNPTEPYLIKRVVIGKANSDNATVLSHHGFSYLPKGENREARFAIPMRIYDAPIGLPHLKTNWQASGLVEFELNDDYSDFARAGELFPYTDQQQVHWKTQDTVLRGRSILFDNRILYYEGGRLWGGVWGDKVPDYVPAPN
ncbi:beta-propeller domain-containing protein [uncultured Pseudoteredinibacter sp.]|uniref:beta-propeller domain-containing protein n=1 Tax=uncultured Pseudoteredinibacter sp. TaxID=1641701 RepID=UPI002614BA45|nr:beta-propeller domain-containing protein [uncultured Pseudoteredinibacter sp.]